MPSRRECREPAPRLALAASLLLVSCTFFAVGDSALRVRGEVVVDQRASTDCILELRLANSDEVIATKSVSTAFIETLLVGPRRTTYYVLIWCAGCPSTFRSTDLEAHRMERYHTPVDLGVVRLCSGDSNC